MVPISRDRLTNTASFKTICKLSSDRMHANKIYLFFFYYIIYSFYSYIKANDRMQGIAQRLLGVSKYTL